MPDENKFTVLRTAGYNIPITCRLCKYGQFPNTGEWGTCGLHKYDHGKHTGDKRGVSVCLSGTCPSSIEDPQKVTKAAFGAHVEFLPGRSPMELPESRGRKQRQ